MPRRETLFGFLAPFAFLVALIGCDDDETVTPAVSYAVTINLDHNVDGAPLVFNQRNYTNAAGNNYQVTRFRYVISDLRLRRTDGTFHGMDGIHFRDHSNPDTRSFSFEVPAGTYDQISFVFGLDESKNIPGMWPELDAVGFNWPLPMGGAHTGYHYMQLEGDYIATSPDQVRSMLTHTGARRFDTAYGSTSDDPFAFHHYFTVTRSIGQTTIGRNGYGISLDLNVNGWYTDPVDYDFNDLPVPMIMGNLDAQQKLRVNGLSCFEATVESP